MSIYRLLAVDCPHNPCDRPRLTAPTGNGRRDLRRNLAWHMTEYHGHSQEEALRVAYAEVPSGNDMPSVRDETGSPDTPGRAGRAIHVLGCRTDDDGQRFCPTHSPEDVRDELRTTYFPIGGGVDA